MGNLESVKADRINSLTMIDLMQIPEGNIYQLIDSSHKDLV